MDKELFWPRAIMLIDMNAFFASIEQRDNPSLRGKPVVITNGSTGTCVITCSYEARRYGIHTGMRLPEAKIRCPMLIRLAANPKKYADVSSRIMAALQENISPIMEVYSIDEAFLDITGCQRLLGDPQTIGKLAKQVVFKTAGVLCSVGIGHNKTMAKFASGVQKPNGLTLIPQEDAARTLANKPLKSIWGINRGIATFLAKYHAYTCGDVANLPVSVLAKRFGHLGRRLWLQCQGEDLDPIQTTSKSPKTMGHGKMLPPGTKDTRLLLNYFANLTERLASRLRRHNMQASHYFIGIKTFHGWEGEKITLINPVAERGPLFHAAQILLKDIWSGEGAIQVQVTALNPAESQQHDLLEPSLNDVSAENAEHSVTDVIDDINDRFGGRTLCNARALRKSPMGQVIAPSWKPSGHRQTID